MSKKDFDEQIKEFVEATNEHFVKWCDEQGYLGSLICSVGIHESRDLPKDVGLIDNREKMHFVHAQAHEFVLEGVKSFPTHARSVLKFLDKYRDEMADDSE
jgi:hypothetical protein